MSKWLLLNFTLSDLDLNYALYSDDLLEATMKVLVINLVLITIMGCAATPPSDDARTGPLKAKQSVPQGEPQASDPTKPVKSPHGYIITKDYDLGRFGGFVGECTDDQNWPYYWQCMSENSGNGGFK